MLQQYEETSGFEAQILGRSKVLYECAPRASERHGGHNPARAACQMSVFMPVLSDVPLDILCPIPPYAGRRNRTGGGVAQVVASV